MHAVSHNSDTVLSPKKHKASLHCVSSLVTSTPRCSESYLEKECREDEREGGTVGPLMQGAYGGDLYKTVMSKTRGKLYTEDNSLASTLS